MAEIIEMGTMSSRGQVCIPSSIREKMGLEEGSRLIFHLEENKILSVKCMDGGALLLLKSLMGSGKRTTAKERKRREEELKTMSYSEILRKFGLDKK